MQIVEISSCPDYVAPDLAVAKEFMSPRASGLQNLSIAQITIPPGGSAKKHYHLKSEEVYQVVSGSGIMLLGCEEQKLDQGQAVAIKEGEWHSIRNDGKVPLVMIVTCSPPWDADDQIFES